MKWAIRSANFVKSTLKMFIHADARFGKVVGINPRIDVINELCSETHSACTLNDFHAGERKALVQVGHLISKPGIIKSTRLIDSLLHSLRSVVPRPLLNFGP